jgi:hypothetical protein
LTQVEGSNPIVLASGEKSSSIMIYNQTHLVRGEVVTPEAVRISTWLRSQGAPDYLHIYNAHVFQQGIAGPAQSGSFHEYFFPTNLVTAYHLVPPAADPIDYDPSEPNRKALPVTALVGGYAFNGYLRMTVTTDLSRFLNVNREAFISLYDIDISNPAIPAMGVIHVPLALIRNRSVILAARDNG